MKRLITFDSYEASAYDVVDAFYPFRSLPGVKSVEVLTASEGSPQFCVILDVEDDKDSSVLERLASTQREYAGYYSNLTNRAYRPVK